jgi:hypothetical protein
MKIFTPSLNGLTSKQYKSIAAIVQPLCSHCVARIARYDVAADVALTEARQNNTKGRMHAKASELKLP